MYGPEILVRTLSARAHPDRWGNLWQYHSRSDHHSKVACWGILFDLLVASPLLRRHVAEGKVGFGINHEMRDFANDIKKDLDVVLCVPSSAARRSRQTLAGLTNDYGIKLTAREREAFDVLPTLQRVEVGAVLLALEAKATMTAHQRALPRLYAELNSSHLTVHGSSDQAIAAGFVMANIATRYLSPDLNKKNRASEPEWSSHSQPRDTQLVIDKIRQLPRRSKPGEVGYDAIGIVVVEATNDASVVRLVSTPPGPPIGDTYHYASMIDRVAHIWATRFQDI